MNRALVIFVSVIIWLGIGTGVVMTWPMGVEAAGGIVPGAPQIAYGAALLVGAMIGLYLNSVLLDVVAGNANVVSVRDLPEDQRRTGVEGIVRRELAAGNYRVAVVAYEEVGMYAEALKLAEQYQDHKLMARIAWRMGRYDRARQHYVKDGNQAGAGNQCVLMGNLAEARKHYDLAADQLIGQGQALKQAGFLDRARRWKEAAPLYEEQREYEKAADCHELTGDLAKSANLRRMSEDSRRRDQRDSNPMARSTTGYSEKISASTARQTVPSMALTATDARNKAAKSAKELRAFGDVYASAWIYREMEMWKEAGECFEQMEEWERAAMCYTRAGMMDRSGMVRTRIPRGSAAIGERTPADMMAGETPAPQGPPQSVPMPGQAPVVPFIPLSQQPVRYVPVGEETLKRLGASLPSEGAPREVWEALAKQLEEKGAFQDAAELYMRLGKVDTAVQVLARQRRPMEAALMAIGIGDLPKAAEFLVDGLEKKNDFELGLLLGELLIRIGDMDLAEKVLRKRLARTITPDNAPFVYQYGRLFEEAGAIERAATIYRSLIEAGADSIELQERLSALEIEIQSRGGQDATPRVGPKDDTRPIMHARREEGEGARFAAGKLLDRASQSGEMPTVSLSAATASAPRFAFKLPTFTPFLGKAKKEGSTAEDLTASLHQGGTQIVSLLGPIKNPSDTRSGRSKQQRRDDDQFRPDNRYTIVKELGRGGMGVVYEARDTVLNRRLALKVINSTEASTDSLKQFLLEARAIAQLTHPNVITIYDVGMLELRHYIAMEFIEGRDLRDHLVNGGRLPLKDALRLFIAIAEGLKAVHEAGIVHRDIKPANVLLTKEMRPKIVDFGLAKLQRALHGEEVPPEELFAAAGTPGYMAPEQARGEELQPAADIYALGITLFAMLAGAPPHQLARLQKPMDIMNYTLFEDLPSIRQHRDDVPEAIEHLYRYCTEREVANRYQSIDAFLPVARQWYEAS